MNLWKTQQQHQLWKFTFLNKKIIIMQVTSINLCKCTYVCSTHPKVSNNCKKGKSCVQKIKAFSFSLKWWFRKKKDTQSLSPNCEIKVNLSGVIMGDYSRNFTKEIVDNLHRRNKIWIIPITNTLSMF